VTVKSVVQELNKLNKRIKQCICFCLLYFFTGKWNHQYDLNHLIFWQTRNVLDCDQSNYSSRIIFSCTFTLEPNTIRTGWTVSEIWPFKIMQDGWRPWSWIWSNRKYVHSIHYRENPTLGIKHEVDRMTRSGDMAVRNFPKCEVDRSVGRRSSILHCSHTLLFATLGT